MTSVLAAFAAAILFTTQSPATTSGPAQDAADEAGIYEVTATWAASVVDYDQDGLQDWLFVKDGSSGVVHSLYHNDGGSFSEVAEGTFTGADLHDCPWSDVNGDGLLDVFCSSGAKRGTGTKLNELFIQQPDNTFVDMTHDYGLDDDIYGRGRSSAFIDANHDAYPDLFVGSFYPRDDGIPSPNRFYINEGGTFFRAAPEYGLDGENGASCAQSADYNGDGWEDLLVCGKSRMLLYRNDAGESFTEVAKSVNVYGFWHDAEMVDWDVDGDLDIVRIRDKALHVRLQQEGTFRPDIDMPLTDGEALATGDVNGDGLPDVYAVQACATGTENLPDQMWTNAGAEGLATMEVPETTQGCGDDVSAIDYDDNGAMDFIVLNGRLLAEGPVQLISFEAP